MKVLTLLTAVALLFVGVARAQDTTSDPVQFKPDRLKFRVVMHRCGSKKVKAINNGTIPINDPVFSVQGTNQFRVDKSFQKCPNPLGPGQTCGVYVAFCPHAAGTDKATLVFSATEVGVPLTGRVRQTRR